jgi:RNA polymerase sigma-70 factor (ECF subfamily)
VLSEGPADAELVRRAREDDAWAWETLYRRHVGLAMQTALRLLRNRAEAEDVVQDSFVMAFRRLSQLREEAAFRGWLVRIVVSRAHRRLRTRRVDALDGLEAEAAADASPMVRAELRLLDEVLGEIRAKERVPWILRHVLGYKLQEVAAACDCSLATAKRRVLAAHAIITRHVSMEGPA